MAAFRYFAEVNGQPVQLQNVRHNGAASTKVETFSGFYEGSMHQAVRKVEYKSNPSRHACDSRCTHATGKVMKCECSCGGHNHGRAGA
jgi:hypothetical protein